MTPAARYQTAIEILDAVFAGAPAEQALIRWARASRFAGSKDRAAVRDLVFDALRKRSSAAACGGSLTGRGVMLGLLALSDQDPEEVFTGAKYGPETLSDAERQTILTGQSGTVPCDVPDWIVPEFEAGLGADTGTVLSILRERAPVFLRINPRRESRKEAIGALADEGIKAEVVPGVETALIVVDEARKIAGSRAFRDGLVEVQDASSQAAVEFMPIPDSGRVLDYCAGGGGKALAMAAISDAEIFAHDGSPDRMKDIPARAERAGCRIQILDNAGVRRMAPFDVVLCDVPCSGTGAWRRSPDARWRFTADDLQRLLSVQRDILTAASRLVRSGGHLVYATCSLLACENGIQLRDWLDSTGASLRISDEMQRYPDAHGDGFYCAVMEEAND